MSLEKISQFLSKIGDIKVQSLILIIANIFFVYICFSYFHHRQITDIAIEEINQDLRLNTIEKVELISDIRDEAYGKHTTLLVSLFTFWFGYSVISNK